MPMFGQIVTMDSFNTDAAFELSIGQQWKKFLDYNDTVGLTLHVQRKHVSFGIVDENMRLPCILKIEDQFTCLDQREKLVEIWTMALPDVPSITCQNLEISYKGHLGISSK
ncbi:eukaryotic translation initiation factor [Ancistrocladus abbreviatus]